MAAEAVVARATRLDRRVRKEAKGLSSEAKKALKTRVKISAAERVALERDVAALDAAIKADDGAALRRLVPPVDAALDKLAAAERKSPIREYAESIGWALAIALLLRAFVVEAFKIPSASMIPTMQIGDFIFVNKLLYGVRIPYTDTKLFTVRDPKPGEVIVFEQPCTHADFIKRVVAVAGDTVEVRCNILYVNGQAVPETLVDPEVQFWDRESAESRRIGGTPGPDGWFLTDMSHFQSKLGGQSFSVFHLRDRPATAAAIAQGWPAFWEAYKADRVAAGVSVDQLEYERQNALVRFRGRDVHLAEFPPSEVDEHTAMPRCSERPSAKSEGVIVRTAPEPDPLNPTCTPRYHYKVPAGHVFMMGDNRDNSNDSREWGPVPLDLVKGKAMFIWLSMGPPLHDGIVERVKHLNPFSVRYERVGNFVH